MGERCGVLGDSKAPDLFHDIGPLQAEGVNALGLDTWERIAASSPGPVLPTIMRTLSGTMDQRPGMTIVDLGAGLGGASALLDETTGARVIAVEPALGARSAARRMFPHLDVRAGTAERSGLSDGVADAVVLMGVVSLIDALDPVLEEARRLLRPGGVLAIADMVLEPDNLPRPSTDSCAGAVIERTGMNTLRSVPALTSALVAHGFSVEIVDRPQDATASSGWGRPAQELRNWLVEHHGDDGAVRAWLEDQGLMSSWFDDGRVFEACVIARAVRPT